MTSCSWPIRTPFRSWPAARRHTEWSLPVRKARWVLRGTAAENSSCYPLLRPSDSIRDCRCRPIPTNSSRRCC
jgi:hypothetical protein